MKTIAAIRHANLLALIEEHGGQASLASRCDTSPTYLSQIVNRLKKTTGKVFTVGNALARKLEAGTGKQPGWMDVEHDPRKDELVEIFQRLKPVQQEKLLEHARTIKRRK